VVRTAGGITGGGQQTNVSAGWAITHRRQDALRASEFFSRLCFTSIGFLPAVAHGWRLLFDLLRHLVLPASRRMKQNASWSLFRAPAINRLSLAVLSL